MAMTFKEQMAGFPVRQMTVVSLIRISEPLAFTSLFPYLYFMIRDFQIAPSEKDIPRYSGYLASSFAFFQFLFSVQWGTLLNRIGRKPVLLCGLLGTSISLQIFGFSRNYYMALAARSLAGALNGNIGVLRTVIGEICVEKKHQAFGFSTLPLLFNMGAIVGPLIGGSRIFTRPNPRSPYEHEDASVLGLGDAFDRFREKYPYAASNVFVGFFLWVSMFIGFFFLEETNDDFKHKRDYGLELGDAFLYKVFGVQPPVRPWQQLHRDSEHFSPGQMQQEGIRRERDGQHSPTERSPLISSDETETHDDDEFAVEPLNDDRPRQSLQRRMSDAVIRRYSLASQYIPKSEPKALTPQVISVIISNCIITLHSIAYNEFLPVLLAGRFQKENLKFPFKIEGGFGLDSSYIGTLFSSTGMMGMFIVLAIFPWIDRTFGTLQGFRLSLSFFPLVYAAAPMVVFTLHKYNPIFPEWFSMVFLYMLTSLKTLASATGMPQVMLLNHRAAAKKHRAYVNALTMSMLALAKFIGPLAFGFLMALGDNHGIAWLAWWLMSLLSLGGLFQAFTMKDYDD